MIATALATMLFVSSGISVDEKPVKLDGDSVQALLDIHDKQTVSDAGQKLLAFAFWVSFVDGLPQGRKTGEVLSSEATKKLVDGVEIVMAEKQWDEYGSFVSAMKDLKKVELLAIAKECKIQYERVRKQSTKKDLAVFWQKMYEKYQKAGEAL